MASVCPVHAVTFVVNNLGDQSDANPGNGNALTPGGFVTLRSAIEELQALGVNGTINFDPSISNTLGSQIVLGNTMPTITRELTINGPGARYMTININGNSRFLDFFNANGSSSVSGFSITGGSEGAVRVIGSSVSFTDCTVANNSATATVGGGITVSSGSTVALYNCSIGPGNVSPSGGGVRVDFSANPSTFVAINTIFRENRTTTGGGGGLLSSGNHTITLVNCTFEANEAFQRGGGAFIISTDGSAMKLISHCTFTNNIAPMGGGISRESNESTFEMRASVFYGNVVPGTSGPDFSGPAGLNSADNFISRGNGMTEIVHNTNGNRVGTIASPLDAMLEPLAANGGPTLTRHPAMGSPLINATDIPPAFGAGDARGVLRPLNGRHDIGAVEVVHVDNLQDVSDGNFAKNQLALREAMLFPVERLRIRFDLNLFQGGHQEILLASALPTLTQARLIEGPGRNLLTLRATSGPIFVLNNSRLLSTIISDLAMTGATASAVHNNASFLQLDRCWIHGNSSPSEGGAVDNDNGAFLTLNDCEIGPNNTAPFGGGIDNDIGLANSLRAVGTLFHGNSTTSHGGAVYLGGAHTGQFINCTITGNTSNGSGGGIYKGTGPGELTIINSTISGNTAASQGRGITSTAVSNLLFMRNTVIAGNLPAGTTDFAGSTTVGNSIHNFIGAATGAIGITNGANGNQIGTVESPLNPMLDVLGDYGGPTKTRRPLTGSPLINTGTPTIPEILELYSITTDARGFDRLFGPAVDIGAVEIQPSDTASPGDVNGDGKVTVADVTTLGNYVTGKIPAIPGNGDINNDGSTNQADVQALAVGIANGVY